MKLYMHPISTTSRPILMFIAESGIDCEMQVVDLMSGEHMQDAYAAINQPLAVVRINAVPH